MASRSYNIILQGDPPFPTNEEIRTIIEDGIIEKMMKEVEDEDIPDDDESDTRFRNFKVTVRSESSGLFGQFIQS